MTGRDVMPEKLGAYRLLDRIGEGGMGVVFLARDPAKRTVALKVLRSTVAGDPTARRRLAREVETMQRVRSPFVAEVIDADLVGETPYIVTRYVPGRTLDAVVSESGPLHGVALARLARGLAEALVAVHAAGVVHRDVKPSNVMLLDGTPVVIDFGIAQGPDATRLTMTGMFMGTPGFLAPEVIEGKPSSEASDVHAWGATVAYAATARPPFGTGPYEGIFYRIINGQPDLAGIPSPMLPLLAGALARDPAHRPTAAQMSAQASLLDPGTLLPSPVVPGGNGSGAGIGAGATRAEAAGGFSPFGAPPGTGQPGMGGVPGGGVPGGGVPGGAGADMPGLVMPGVGLAGADGYGLPGAGRLAETQNANAATANGGPTLLPGTGLPGTGLPGVGAGGLGGNRLGGNGLRNGAAGGAAPGWPGTYPPAGARSLSDDLGDVLTPVRYQAVAGAAGGPAAPAGAAAGRAMADGSAGAASRPARWQPLLVLAAMAVLVGASVIMPVLGTLTALALIVALRAGGLARRKSAARRMARGARPSDPLVSALGLPWFLARSLVTLVLLSPFAVAAAALVTGITVAFVPEDWPGRALAYGAGTLVAFYALGPGSQVPRQQLGRMFLTVTRTPSVQLTALIVMAALAVAALSAAASWPSSYWPALAPAGSVHIGVLHLTPLRQLDSIRHAGLVHRILMLRGLVMRRFG